MDNLSGPHGTSTSYNKGCRCELCRRAQRERHKAWRDRVAKEGSRRPVVHGKPTTYTNHSCRCEACTAAHTEAFKRFKAQARHRPPAAVKHGALTAYMYNGCRCELCREAGRQARARYKSRVARNKAKMASPPLAPPPPTYQDNAPPPNYEEPPLEPNYEEDEPFDVEEVLAELRSLLG